MAFEIVVPAQDDFPAVFEPVFAAFGQTRPSDEAVADASLEGEHVRPIAARDGDRWVGLAGDYPFELTVPGGATCPTAGVTWVGVLPTHRRQGITTALMARLLDDAAARGDVFAALLAMEAPIYGRFGFGVATQWAEYEIDASRASFAVDPVDTGSLRLVDHEEGSALAEQVWDVQRVLRHGSLSRMPWMWELARRDRADDRAEFSALFWVVHHDADGAVDGYVTYRVKEGSEHGLPRATAKVFDLVGATSEVEAVLFRYVCDLDLVQQVQLDLRPVDDHLRWRLADPRQYRTTMVADFLWLRLIDVPAALAARTYGPTDELVLDVTDEFRPASGGRFVVRNSWRGPSCEPAAEGDTTVPDLSLDASALASLYLGTVPASTLAAAGRLTGSSPDALARADAFFATTPAPFCTVEF